MSNKMNYQLTAISLKQQIVNLALPKNFNSTKKYHVYLVLDGKEMLTDLKYSILTNNRSNSIYVGLNSTNNATRFNNLATYHNQQVKQLLTKHFPELNHSESDYLGGQGQVTIDFISKDLLPWLIKNQKIQIADLNFIGCSMGAYFSLQMLYLSNLTFKKVALFSPSIWFNQQILTDLKMFDINGNEDIIINLWVGRKEPKLFEKTIATNYLLDATKLQAILATKSNIKLNFFIDDNGSHGFKWWINFFNQHQELY